MKRFIFCIVLVMSITGEIYAQYPQDIPTIEALISNHKSSYNLLEKRKNKAALNMAISNKVKTLATEYEILKKNVSKKMEIGYTSLELVYEVSQVTQNLIKVTPLLKEYVSFAIQNATKSPLLYQYYIKSYKGTLAEINKCKDLFIYGNVISSNLKEKLHILQELNSSLTTMIYHLDSALFMGRGLIALDMSYKESFEELMQSPEVKAHLKKVVSNIKSNMRKK